MSGCYSSGGKRLSTEWERRVLVESIIEVAIVALWLGSVVALVVLLWLERHP